uniref:Uncharacterized protein n=1 Tax=viral metagenome TaxID=1070528 RepID=A0A6C0EG18_9ZZZZ
MALNKKYTFIHVCMLLFTLLYSMFTNKFMSYNQSYILLMAQFVNFVAIVLNVLISFFSIFNSHVKNYGYSLILFFDIYLIGSILFSFGDEFDLIHNFLHIITFFITLMMFIHTINEINKLEKAERTLA